MIKRLYIIEYDHYVSMAGKYGISDPKKEKIIYSYDERQEFLKKYIKLTNDDMFFDNIRTYYCDYGENEITNKMNDLIERI
ncbi:MAG: hypothetical protein ACOCP8_01590 [archaeon]